MKSLALCTLALASATVCLTAQSPIPPPAGEKAEILSLRKIWDKSKHSAASDILRWQNLWYVAFRTGDTAAGSEGQIQILTSFDTVTWSPVSVVSEKGVDLREPKLEVTKEKRMILFMEGVTYDRGMLASKQPRVTTSTDGKNWVPPQKYLTEGDWMFRPAWHEKEQKFYGVSYHTHPTTPGPKPEKEWTAKLYSSLDGKVWQLTAPWQITGLPKESTVRVMSDDTMVALIGRDGGDKRGAFGTAKPPYSEWTWKPLEVPVMAPNLVLLPDGRVIGASLGFGATPGGHVVIFEIKEGAFVPLLELPSAGECGHPGLVWNESQLVVSYHSSHEDKKPAIYFAKVRLK